MLNSVSLRLSMKFVLFEHVSSFLTGVLRKGRSICIHPHSMQAQGPALLLVLPTALCSWCTAQHAKC